MFILYIYLLDKCNTVYCIYYILHLLLHLLLYITYTVYYYINVILYILLLEAFCSTLWNLAEYKILFPVAIICCILTIR